MAAMGYHFSRSVAKAQKKMILSQRHCAINSDG